MTNENNNIQLKINEEYWTNKLSADFQQWNFAKLTNSENTSRSQLNFTLDPPALQQIKNQFAKSDLAFFTFALSALKVLFYRYSSNPELITATSSFQPNGETPTLGSYYIGCKFGENFSFLDVLKLVKEEVMQAHKHRELSPDFIEKQLLEENPVLNQLSFVYNKFQNALPKGKDYGIEITLDESGNLLIDFNDEFIDIEFAFGIATHYNEILKKVSTDLNLPIENLDFLLDTEKEELIQFLPDTETAYPKQKSLSLLFEEKVAEFPEQIAVTFKDQHLSHKELNERANQVAHYLIKSGGEIANPIGVLLNRSCEMIIAIMGILKAGGTYVPLDPDFPQDRIDFILNDSKCKIVLSEQALEQKIPQTQKTVLVTDEAILSEEKHNLKLDISSDTPAYIIYTSGSTGIPKGTVIAQYSVSRVVLNTNYIVIKTEDNILQLSTVAFDGSVFDIFGALLNGARLVLIEKEHLLNLKELLASIESEKISVLFITTALFNTLVDTNLSALKSLSKILFGGERVSVPHVKHALQELGSDVLVHVYGPTESTVFATYFPIDSLPDDAVNIPIGKALSNTEIYVLNPQLQLQTKGTCGQLCISGMGLSSGYLNNPELTASSFVDHPYKKGQKLYLTGDLVKLLPDGNIEFVDRLDQQVKIRGFRIELGEIEHRILKLEGIRECVVVALSDEGGNKFLSAYFTAQKPIDKQELKVFIGEKLPAYMLPAHLIQLKQMPLNANGKIDKKQLPDPDENEAQNTLFVAPETPTEIRLAEIWQELLKVKQVGKTDNFFELGGHSLKASVLLFRLQEEFGVKIPMGDFFALPTVASCAELLDKIPKNQQIDISKAPLLDSYPLSPAQKRMFLLNEFEGAGTSYNMPGFFRIKGELDVAKFRSVFQQLVDRHESFRTRFVWKDGEASQYIETEIKFEIEEKEIAETEIEQYLKAFVRQFDLGKAPLLRVSLLSIDEQNFLFLFDMHHIISDGISMSILFTEFMSLYRGENLPELKIQYKDYAWWHAEQAQQGANEAHEKYWLETFAGDLQHVSLPLDFKRPETRDFKGEVLQFQFSKTQLEALRKLAQRSGTTLYMTLLAAYNVLLAKYSGESDIVVGSPASGRGHASLQEVIGMFVNTLALRNDVSGEKSFSAFLQEVKQHTLEAFDHDSFQFEELVDKLKIKRDLGQNPLFDTMFALQNISFEQEKIGDLQFIPIAHENKVAKFDLFLEASESENSLDFTVSYASSLFKKESIQNFAFHFSMLVDAITADPECKIKDLSFITDAEKHRVLYTFNETKKSFPDDKNIAQLFEEQVIQNPDAPALIFEDQHYSYAELNAKANQLAQLLLQKGVVADQAVGIVTERNAASIIGILAIIKASGAYLPIDPNFPIERSMEMLRDATVKIVLCQEEIPEELKASFDCLHLDSALAKQQSDQNPIKLATSNSLAYILFTSGSTGQPKGVLIEQKSVVRLVKNTNYIDLKAENRIFLTGALTFDATTFEIWGALLNGASLYISSQGKLLNPLELSKLLREYKIDTLWLTVNFFNQLLETDIDLFAPIKTILVGGDRLSPYHINKLRAHHPYININNVYGPTENTTFTTYFPINENFESDIPIGKPIANTSIYILDEARKPVPVGIAGEIYIGGAGLARAYLNDESQTAQKFIQLDDKSEIPDKRLYRTGDLAKWDDAGNIHFLGRNDSQVKLRGFRIELGEIENTLLLHPAISEAVVLLFTEELTPGESNKYLCAYYAGNKEIEASELRNFLAQSLPDYMLPSIFVLMDKLPLNRNGKIDKKALPLPNIEQNSAYENIAPITPTELVLCEIWSKILGINNPGTNNNFFELGGHSLRAMQVIALIGSELDVQITLTEFFKNPTILQLGMLIDGKTKNRFEAIEAAPISDYYPLSAQQNRMYILHALNEQGTTYNMPFFVKIKGPLDQKKLLQTFRFLIERHESLRSSFHLIDGEIKQKIHSQTPFEVPVYAYDENSINQFVVPFDLETAPLMRVALMQISSDEHLLLTDLHHIISDGNSIQELLKEFAAHYEGELLPEINIQYKDYAYWQQLQLSKESYRLKETFWLDQFGAKGNTQIPLLNLPTDFPRPAVQLFDGDRVLFQLNSTEAQALKQLAKQNESTLFMVLLAAYSTLLAKYSGQDDIIVGTPVSGRAHASIQDTIGMFVNTLALRSYPEADKSFKEYLQELTSSGLRAFENQDYPFEELVEKLGVPRDLGRNPLFDTMFTLQSKKQELPYQGNLRMEAQQQEATQAKFDLFLEAFEGENEIALSITYSSHLFKKESIEQLARHFVHLTQQIIANPEAKLAELSLLTKAEKEQLLDQAQAQKLDYPRNQNLASLIEEQVDKNPEQVALFFEEQQITYAELNKRANRIANSLLLAGVQANQTVALLLDRSPDMLIAMLGVLKSGAAYVPVDPNYPEQRIRYMLEDCKAKLLLTDQVDLPDFNGTIIRIKDLKNQQNLETNPIIERSATDLAYIIYTSGSTGNPKGVALTQQNAVSFIHWCFEEFKNSDFNLVFAGTSYSFDLSIFELFYSLAAGKQIRLLASGLAIGDYLQTDDRILLNTVPTVIKDLLERGADLRKVKAINMAGEPIPLSIKEKLNYDSIEVRNLYGPSEDTTYSTAYRLTNADERQLIGLPIANTQAYIVDESLNLLANGLAGELCLAGDGLAQSYLHKEELTAEKFIANPFTGSGKMYRTGDLVRRLTDGNLEYLGRIDQQVKIRGFRIELGEIESRLLEIESITEAVVVSKISPDGSTYLCAYYAINEETELASIRSALSETLPDYMIPTAFMQLETLPLTPNGKVDKKALPDAEMQQSLRRHYLAPSNETEQKLIKIWEELLQVDEIGAGDHFFELGGHSLKATQLLSRVHKEFGVQLPLGQVFKNPVLKDLAAQISGSESLVFEHINKAAKRETYPLSSAQKRLYVLNQMEGPNIGYNMPGAVKWMGKTDKIQIQQAFDKLLQRHESLRTSFALIEDEPIQRISQNPDFKVEFITCKADEIQQKLSEFVIPFDLEQAPLLRVCFCEIGKDESVLFFDMHHIISDGASMQVLLSEFVDLIGGKNLSPLKLQYTDYACWQQEQFSNGILENQRQFWLDQLSEEKTGKEIPVLDLPTDFSRPVIQDFEGSELSFHIDQKLVKAIESLSLKTGTTIQMILLSGFKILLSKYARQEDLLLATPVSGRSHADLQNLVGMFVNTLVYRSFPEAEKSFLTYLNEVKQIAIAAYENQDYPFDELISDLNLERQTGRNPLFDVMFVYQENEKAKSTIRDSSLAPVAVKNTVSKFDLSLKVAHSEGKLAYSLEFARSLFSEETIQRMGEHFNFILKQALAKPELKLAELQLCDPEESKQILDSFQAAKQKNNLPDTIIEAFNAVVESKPNQSAVQFASLTWSYSELQNQAQALATFLLEKGVKKGETVGVLLARSEKTVLSMLGIMQAGAVYLPIDPDAPKERIDFMLSDSSARFLLVDESTVNSESGSLEQINLSEISLNKTGQLPKVAASDLAYIIYTSGSTGQPKGVLLEHGGFMNMIEAQINIIGVNETDNCLQFASPAFDASLYECLMALLSGASLHVLSKETIQDTGLFKNFLLDHKITVATLPPVYLSSLMQSELPGLRKLITAGEQANLSDVRFYARKLDYFNAYGPTETSVCASIYPVKKDELLTGNVPIGKALPNTEILILDKQLNLMPVGVPGEICVTGAGLARGYLNRDDMNASAFVTYPPNGKRLYRTGDLGKWLPDGNLLYLGRTDEQIKIRGYRIEPGEIEARLSQFPSIKETVVLARKDLSSTMYLCAYFTADKTLEASEIKSYLSDFLPDYMLPSYFVQIENIPLTSNGKIDKKALPEPKSIALSGENYAPPRNETERILSEVWQKTLGLERIGIYDDFFASGGDSIKAIQIASRVLAHGLKLEVKNLFRYSTIALLSPHVQQAMAIADQNTVGGSLPLTPIQHWFVEQNFSAATHWNQSLLFFYKGRLDENLLRKAVLALLKQHDALRMRLESKTEAYIKPWSEDYEFPFTVFDFSQTENDSAAIREHAQLLQAGLSLNKTLFKVALFRTNTGDHLLFVVHHLLTDGVSWRILIEDLSSAYSQLEAGQKISLPAKTHSYLHWSQKLKSYAESKQAKKELTYWQHLSSQEVAQLPKKSKTRKKNQGSEILNFSLDAAQTDLLLKKANQAYHTSIDDLLLTALALSVKQWTTNSQTLIHLEGHGREELFNDLDITRTVGWFTSVYPVLLTLASEDDLSLQIRNIKENLRAIPNKGVGFGILKYLSDEKTKSTLDCKADISFNYLGQFDQDVQKESKWGISGISIGDSVSQQNERVAALEINCMVSGGQLRVNLGFHPEELDAEELKLFSEQFKVQLLKIVDHCASIEIPVKTPGDFPNAKLSIDELDYIHQEIQGEIAAIYTLAPMQLNMLYQSELDKDSNSYFQQTSFTLNSQPGAAGLDVSLVEQSFQCLLDRYTILRTNFISEGLQIPHQIVHSNRPAEVHFEDLSGMEDSATYIHSFKEQDKASGFDLKNDSLIRISLFQISPNSYHICWSFHHILMDGWCLGLVMKDFFAAYQAYSQGLEPQLAAVNDYENYISWLNKNDESNALDYWQNYLLGYEQNTILPGKIKTHKKEAYRLEVNEFRFSHDEFTELKQWTVNQKVTVNDFFQSVWALLLQQYNQSSDVVFGAVISGRPSAIIGIEAMVGLFINTIPVRVQTDSDISFETLVRQVHEGAVNSLSHGYLPLSEIQNESSLKQGLLDHVLIFENFPLDENISETDGSGNEKRITDVEVFEQTNYSFNVSIIPGKDLCVRFSYDSNTYSKEVVNTMAQHLRELLLNCLRFASKPAKQISLLSEAEKELLTIGFNQTAYPLPKASSIIELFEEQVVRFPEKTALWFRDEELSFAELNAKANQLAAYLAEQNLIANDIVALVLPRSSDMLIAMLAILKAGAAYLPIDPTYPKERIDFIVQDSGAKLIIDDAYLNRFLTSIRPLADGAGVSNTYSTENTGVSINPHDLAYIIYTSGSTGQPKGVMLEHRNVLSFQQNLQVNFGINTSDRILGVTTTTFDISVLELLCSLMNGLGIVLADEEQIEDLYQLAALIREKEVTVVQSTPSRLQILIEACGIEALAELNTLLVGGEALPYSLAEQLKTLEKTKVYNVYGPTEACIWSAFSDVKKSGISIGKALLNEQIYILSPELEIQGLCIPGELCIAGKGLARAYLNREELTDSVFVSNPFKTNEKLYRTGDLAQWMPDGNLQYIGRVDHQVKIRGYRIELGEIEYKIGMHPEVKEAVVSVFTEENGTQSLCAYYTLQNQIASSEIRQFLSANLPEYMVPSYLMELEFLPLMSNGKVNRKSLPLPENKDQLKTYKAPETELQRQLAAIWEAVLYPGNSEAKAIGINDNFFELGGHSLKATQLVSRVRKMGYMQLNLRQFFEYPEIAALATYLEKGEYHTYKSLAKIPEQEFYDLSPTQHSFWLSNKLADGEDGYVLFGAVKSNESLNPTFVSGAFSSLIQRHESLRSSFIEVSGIPKQIVHKLLIFEPEIIDLSQDEKATDRLEELIDLEPRIGFNLTQPPLLRVKLVLLPNKESALLFAAHHIIGDGWSMDLLVREFITEYEAEKLNKKSQISAPLFAYKDFAHWEIQKFEGEGKTQLENFWAKHLQNSISTVALPYDRSKSNTRIKPGADFNIELDTQFQEDVYKYIRQQKLTLNSFLLAAFNLFLAKLAHQDEISLRTISTGRKLQESEDVIGAFVRPFVVKNFPSNDKIFAQFAKEVQQRFLEAEENSAYPLEKLLEQHDQLKGGLNVSFALQNLQTVQISDPDQTKSELRFTNIRPANQQAQNDLLLQVNESAQGFACHFNYRSDLFRTDKIALFADWFQSLLKQVLAHPEKTLSDFNLGDGTEAALFTYLKQNKEGIEAIYPLTTVQRDLYLDSIINPEERAHNLSYFIELNTKIDPEIWNKAIQLFVDNTPIIRASILLQGEEIYQKIARNQVVNTEVIQFNEADFMLEKLEIWIDDVVKRPYDFAKDKLHRSYLVEVKPDLYYAIFGVHHSLFDGWSYKVFYEKVSDIYEKLLKGEKVELAKDYYFPRYINQHLNQFDTLNVLQYWKRKLSGIEPLSVSKAISGEQLPMSKKISLNPEKWNEINAYCKQHQLSTALYFKSLYAYLLKCYAYAKDDFVIHELTGTRTGEFALDAIGCLYHALPQRFSPSYMGKGIRILDYMLQVKNQKKELGERQFLSVSAKNKFLTEENAVFYFNYQSYLNLNILNKPSQLLGHTHHGKNQIQLLLREWEDELQLILDYNSAYFEDFDLLDRMLNLSDQILNGAVFMDELLLDNSVKESKKEVAYPKTETIHSIIEKQAAQRPQQVAIRFEGHSMTYNELNSQANQLANYLLSTQNIVPDQLIGIMMERSELMIVAILAVLKTGAAYLPIDPAYPEDRIQYILEDSNTSLLLGNVEPELGLANGSTYLNLSVQQEWKKADTKNPQTEVKPNNLAYVIYTSGTTGQPKGTMIEHRNVVRLLVNDDFQFAFNENDCWTMFHSFSFDFSVWELFGALFYGGRLLIVPKETAQNTAVFLNLLKEEKVTVLNQIPSIFSSLMHEELRLTSAELQLKYLIFGGDMLKPASLKAWRNRYPETKIINMYGITETTVHVTYKEITELEINAGISNIGKAIPTLECLIMDENLHGLPVGIPGEICVSGEGVARGYLNKDELTASKFVQPPIAIVGADPNKKLYRSGDLGRLLPGGDLEYLGRIDQQVKIRGFRIELGEIENALQKHGQIRLSLVLAKEIEKGTKDLVAYYESDTELDVMELRQFLSGFLPDYMLPSYFVQVPYFPNTTNGKIDRHALPDPLESLRNNSTNFVEANSETEHKLCAIWAELLNIPQVGITDNFFALGGHSLKIIQLISQIQQIWNLDLPVKVVFEKPTVEAIARYIDTAIRLNMKSVDEVGTLLNDSGKDPLFFFPSGGGFGLTYKELAKQVATHSFYGMNFIEAENRMDQYITYLKEIQPEGGFVLGGYSAGGNLAFRVARELENRGEKVSCLLFFDVPYRDETADFTAEEVKSRALTLIYGSEGSEGSNLFQNDYLKEKVESKVEAYLHFLYSGTDEGKINAPIYLIKSEEIVPEHLRDRRVEWQKSTSRELTLINGFGEHGDMLAEHNLIKNAELFIKLLEIKN